MAARAHLKSCQASEMGFFFRHFLPAAEVNSESRKISQIGLFVKIVKN